MVKITPLTVRMEPPDLRGHTGPYTSSAGASSSSGAAFSSDLLLPLCRTSDMKEGSDDLCFSYVQPLKGPGG